MIKCKTCEHEKSKHQIGNEHQNFNESGVVPNKNAYCRLNDCGCNDFIIDEEFLAFPATDQARQLWNGAIQKQLFKMAGEMEETGLSRTEALAASMDKLKDIVSLFYAFYEFALTELELENGLGHSFQDQDGTVYQLDIPNGTFVSFKNVTLNRTRRKEIGEKAGSLGLTAARDLGFEVEGKGGKREKQ